MITTSSNSSKIKCLHELKKEYKELVKIPIEELSPWAILSIRSIHKEYVHTSNELEVLFDEFDAIEYDAALSAILDAGLNIIVAPFSEIIIKKLYENGDILVDTYKKAMANIGRCLETPPKRKKCRIIKPIHLQKPKK